MSKKIEISAQLGAALRDEYGDGCTDAQWVIFMEMCNLRGAMPGKDVHLIMHNTWEYDEEEKRKVKVKAPAYITSVHFLRALAERSGTFRGIKNVLYYYLTDGKVGEPSTIPLPGTPYGVSVTVLRDNREPLTSFARYEAYVSRYKKDNVYHITDMWARRGPEQTLKCAIANGLRDMFPEDLAGLYAAEEFERIIADSKEVAQQKEAPADTVVANPVPNVAAPAPVSNAKATVEGAEVPAGVSKKDAVIQTTVFPPAALTVTEEAKALDNIATSLDKVPPFEAPDPPASILAIGAAPTPAAPAPVPATALPGLFGSVPAAPPAATLAPAQPDPPAPTETAAPAPVAPALTAQAEQHNAIAFADNGPLPTVDVYNGYLQRGKKFTIEVLAPGGMGASKGTTATAKLKKYFLAVTGKAELKEITVGAWEALFASLDAFAKTSNEAAVTEVENRI